MISTLHALGTGPNRCDTITAEHWRYLLDTLPIRTGHDLAAKGDDDGIIAAYFSRKWHGGYTDYKDHRKDGAKTLRALAYKELANRLITPQYVAIFRDGIPEAFRVTGYMGGISITIDDKS